MTEQPEYAEEYSTRERIRIIAVGAIGAAVLVGISQTWFFPWLREFSASAQCRTVFNLNGLEVLYYGLFVGLPLLVALTVGLSFGRRGHRILKEGRVPPSGEKVFRPTRIEWGAKAKLVGLTHLVAVVPPLALALWGTSQSALMLDEASAHPQVCAMLAVDHH